MITVNIHEAKANLSKLLQKALEGEEVVIAKRNEPIAKLVALKEQDTDRLGWAEGLGDLAPDFDEPLEDFSDYMFPAGR